MRKTRYVSKAAIAVPGSSLLVATLMLGATGAPAVVAAQAVAIAPPTVAPTVSIPANGVGSPFELAFWQSVTGSEDAASYEAYLAKYPDGTFSGLARAKIAGLQRALAAQSAVAAAAAPTPMPAPVPAVLAAPQPALAPTPAVVTAATPTAGPGLAAAASQAAEMIPANAALAPAEPSSPLTNLLAQLRGNAQPVAAAAPAPLVTAAPPVQPALAAAPAAAPALVAALPANPAQAYPPAAAAVPTPAASPAVSYAAARPVMLPVPEVTMPASFCSTDQRNAFHNTAYRPAVEAATRNNEAAVTYLRQLQQTYDRGQLGRDTVVLNAIAAEARAYQAEAARAYSAQAALVHQFDVLMAVPVHTCVASAQ